jgi:hypothetical protein
MVQERHLLSPMKDPKFQPSCTFSRRALSVFLSGLMPGLLFSAAPDANSIMQRSAEVLQMDWEAAPTYDYFERDQGNHGSRTWQVLMIQGSPFRRLKAVGATPLSPQDQERRAGNWKQPWLSVAVNQPDKGRSEFRNTRKAASATTV